VDLASSGQSALTSQAQTGLSFEQYEWTGTQDFTQFFSIKAALQFRKDIGGEERIMAYCHSLAVQ
jgi:hypothetical protein